MARKTTVNLHLDPKSMEIVVGSASKAAVEKAASQVRYAAQANITSAGRVDTGELRDRIDVEEIPSDPMHPAFAVTARARHAIFNELGTKGAQAKPGKFLRFTIGSRVIYAKKVKGIKGIHFMRNALESLTPADFDPR